MDQLCSPLHQPNHFRLGLAMWSHSNWQESVYGHGTKQAERLARYATIFNTVEGNTSFYATPAQQTVMNWHSATPESFRFTFKLPQTITHQRLLQHCGQELKDFFQIMTPLIDKTGIWKIQLPAHFGPENLPALAQFLDQIPQGLTYGVEVRHAAFFAKGDAERALNRLLIDKKVNRIIMDSRPLFALPPCNVAIIDAHKKKPRVPVHAIATANNPVVRFIGQPDDAIAQLAQQGVAVLPKDNDTFFDNWLTQLPQWLAEGREPYLFIHTPDNEAAPELAIRLYQKLRSQIAAHIHLAELRLLDKKPEETSTQMGLSW
ncbi:MAG: DUF72 domain-containing protein [Shewanella sp.]|uniref:DUF72 domain-containing protein n=1 Tax=Shewanella TaxID=22 RepID=UPI0021DACE89|nr:MULTISPECIES: DUF72 domain-containing protein [unclassified Shewanella]MCU8033218.1 DUF72 domain-containing protein [Shewanella sp. SM71]MCU8097946.1 DUF72 domain-containing protein [Shewanella sp. SM102]